MTQTISDKELLRELEIRFENNKKLLQEQVELMSELKSVNEKLIASEGLKSNFLSNIRNEINNPLASILEMSKNISGGRMDTNNRERFSTLIFNEAFNLDFQLRNIFASAEIEAGEAFTKGVVVNIQSIIENTIASFKHLLQKKNITLSYVHQNKEVNTFCTDAEKLHLIVSNLISNAIQFSPENSNIEMESNVANKQLNVWIKDNGQGVRDEELTLIFDRFRQLEEGSTKTYGGHGLGLSIVKALLELMDGSVSIISQKGKGSLFIVNIPEAKTDNSEVVFSSEGNDFLFIESDSEKF